MEFEVTKQFEKDYKRLIKKYPSLNKDLEELKKKLTTDPNFGVSLSGGFHKIRLSIKSKGKGTRSGARIITFNCIISNTTNKIIFVVMYDKSEQENIDDKTIIKAFNTI